MVDEAEDWWRFEGGRPSRCVAVIAALGLLLSAVGGAGSVHWLTVGAQSAPPDAGAAVGTATVTTEAPSGPAPTATPTPSPQPTTTPEPVVTTTPDPTPAEAELSTPALDATAASPSATAEPTAVTPTPAPATRAPPDLTGGEAQDADPGTTVTFRHTLTDRSGAPARYDIRATSAGGWPVALFEADGVTPLTDPEPLAPGASRAFVVRVAVPADALAGSEDVTTVTARSGDLVATAVDTTRVSALVALRIESADVAFGEVRGTGEVDPAVAGVASRVDAGGAFYVKEDAIRLTVTSNAPWTGACFGRDVAGSAPISRLAWRSSGSDEWTPFAAGPPAPAGNPCFPLREVGTTIFGFDLRLRVDRADPPGAFAARVSFVVAPAERRIAAGQAQQPATAARAAPVRAVGLPKLPMPSSLAIVTTRRGKVLGRSPC